MLFAFLKKSDLANIFLGITLPWIIMSHEIFFEDIIKYVNLTISDKHKAGFLNQYFCE